ncbi:acylphosphatase [Vibrio cholerae]|nr:acylphosphatase [Vibrio cholerae]
MDKQCNKFIVSGHVQGVGFRYHTSHQGLKLGFNGLRKKSQ